MIITPINKFVLYKNFNKNAEGHSAETELTKCQFC